jgi:hypothetical protein
MRRVGPSLLILCHCALGQVGKPMHIEQLQCKALTCAAAEGWQPGLTTIEVEGHFPQYAGRGLSYKVIRKDASKLALERKAPVMSNGKMTISIPAYNLENGDYVFALTPVDQPGHVLAGGVFRKVTPESKAPESAGGTSFVGEWRGMNGTAGAVVIQPGGAYTFNGARGAWRSSGNGIVFTGPLAAWDGGRAHLRAGVIEFAWTTPAGAHQWFTFGRVR